MFSKSFYIVVIFLIISLFINYIQYKNNTDIITNNQNNNYIVKDTIYTKITKIDTIFTFNNITKIDTIIISDSLHTQDNGISYTPIFNKNYIDTLKFDKSFKDSLLSINIKMDIKHSTNLLLSVNDNNILELVNNSNFNISNITFNPTLIYQMKQIKPKQPLRKHIFITSEFGLRTDVNSKLYILNPTIGIIYNNNKLLYNVNLNTNRIMFGIGYKIF